MMAAVIRRLAGVNEEQPGNGSRRLCATDSSSPVDQTNSPRPVLFTMNHVAQLEPLIGGVHVFPSLSTADGQRLGGPEERSAYGEP